VLFWVRWCREEQRNFLSKVGVSALIFIGSHEAARFGRPMSIGHGQKSNSPEPSLPLSTEDQARLTRRVNSDGQHAIEALRLEGAGFHEAAIEKWKYIFISGFPR